MSITIPGIWFPVDFYIGVSRTRKRTLHVPQKVVDLWAESHGIRQHSIVLNAHIFVRLIFIVDFQLSKQRKLFTFGKK